MAAVIDDSHTGRWSGGRDQSRSPAMRELHQEPQSTLLDAVEDGLTIPDSSDDKHMVRNFSGGRVPRNHFAVMFNKKHCG